MTGTDGSRTRAPLRRAVLVGVLAGFLSGLFGVGGGSLLVPGLVLLMHLDQRLAHGVSLTAVVPIAAASTLSYAFAGEVDWVAAGFLVAGALGGAVLGTYFLNRLPARTLGIAFAVVMLVTAVRLVFETTDAPGRGPLTLLAATGLVATGLAAGVLAGLLGVGGGVVMVPVMVVGFEMPAALAKGTSLAVIIPTAMVGTWRNLRNGNTDLPIAAAAGFAGVASGVLGGQVSLGMSDALSNALFAVLLVVMTVQMLSKLPRRAAG